MSNPPPPVRAYKRPGPPVRAYKRTGLLEVIEVLTPTSSGRLRISGFRTIPSLQTMSALTMRRTDRDFSPPNMAGFLEGLRAKKFFELNVRGQMTRYFVEG
jgi:hypothetical protein